MRGAIAKLHAGLAWVMVAAVVVQFFLAGIGAFGAESYQAHMINGSLITLGSLILLVLALVGRLGRERIGISAALVLLTILQMVLAEGTPWVAALHPVNALLILGASVQLARLGTARELAVAPARQAHDAA